MTLARRSFNALMQAVEVPLKVAQTAALLEVVHSAVGLVRSPIFITGRLRCCWCCYNFGMHMLLCNVAPDHQPRK